MTTHSDHAETPPDPDQSPDPISFQGLLVAGAAVGVFGGFVAYAYATTLHLLLDGVWEHARPFLAGLVARLGLPAEPISLLAITGLGGLLVGVSLKLLGAPGEIAAVVNNIHLKDGRIPTKQTPSMIVASLLSITAGGSAGPEAPLVQIVGSAGSWMGDRWRRLKPHAHTLTFCGMAAALGAFFGAPLAGAVFALEIPHRNGLEYYEALLPSILSAFLSFWIYDSLSGHPQPLFPLQFEISGSASALVPQALLLGALGAAAAFVFSQLFRLTRWAFERWHDRYIALGLVGGLLLGLISLASPSQFQATTLFWGEYEMRTLLDQIQSIHLDPTWIAPLLALALLKALAVGATLNTGFRGGFIFPLFFIGGVLGIAAHLVSGGWLSLPISVICLMAATNVGVTRTPISTTILLGTLTGTAAVPLVLAASLTSFFLTAQVRLIRTQRPRAAPGFLTWRDSEA